ncbi:MAG: arylsulfatase [Planctomycetaceae bacterium]
MSQRPRSKYFPHLLPQFSRALIWAVAVAGVFLAENARAGADAKRPPNIVFILADDLGYGDLGCFGSTRIRTPHIDRLAADGMRLTRHYSGNAVCAPSRCVLMTGLHPGHAFIRNNRTMGEEGQYPIPAGTKTLARRFHDAGYVCGAFGKWGLGGPFSEGAPLKQGVDRFFGYNCQGMAHNFYPATLWDNDRRTPLDNPPFKAHQPLPADADPNDPASYARYRGNDYSGDVIQTQTLKFIRDNHERPFFLYVPSTIPHMSLQVPEDSLREYIGKIEDTPYKGERRYLPHQYPHACYAAMVSRLDRYVGEIVAEIEKLGLSDNTIIVFTSDNGGAAGGVGGSDSDFFNSTGGLTGRKGSLQEGGIRVPGIVCFPKVVPAGKVSARITGFEDWTPTLFELAGLKLEDASALDGISFAETLRGKEQPARPFLYREFVKQQAVWSGQWKAFRDFPKDANATTATKTELYDLEADPTESHDIAAENPDEVKRLEAIMKAEHVPSEIFPLAGVDGK